jgi:hypothetical protein
MMGTLLASLQCPQPHTPPYLPAANHFRNPSMIRAAPNQLSHVAAATTAQIGARHNHAYNHSQHQRIPHIHRAGQGIHPTTNSHRGSLSTSLLQGPRGWNKPLDIRTSPATPSSPSSPSQQHLRHHHPPGGDNFCHQSRPINCEAWNPDDDDEDVIEKLWDRTIRSIRATATTAAGGDPTSPTVPQIGLN